MRTDLDIVQLPTPLPNFGGLLGKNTIQTDPNFLTKMVRLTDASFSANRSMQTADAMQAVLWNTDDTLLLVRNTEAQSFMIQFNPVTMQGSTLPYSYAKTGLAFSRVSNNILFTLDGTVLGKTTFAEVSGTWVLVLNEKICDFKDILPAGFKVKWTSSFIGSIDDSQFSVGFSEGEQGTAFTVCVYRVGSGFRMLNTQTGAVTGQWGTVGTAVLKSPTMKIPFTLHEVYTTPNNNYVMLTPFDEKTSTQFVWNVEGLAIQDNELGGHEAHGMITMYSGGPGGGQLAYGAYVTPTIHKDVVPAANLPASKGQKYVGDRHFEFGKVNAADDGIIWSTGVSVNPYVSAWQSELIGYSTVTGSVYRACHTFNSNRSTEFIVANALAVGSQTGKFVAFTSDMMGNLGATTGSPKGILGKDARGDVFVANVEGVGA